MQHSLIKRKSTSKNTSERMATENKKRVTGTQVRRSFCDEKVKGHLVYNHVSKDTNQDW